MCDDEQVELADSDKARQHDDHGAGGIASSAKCACKHMVYAVKQQEKHIYADEHGTKSNNIFISCEQSRCG